MGHFGTTHPGRSVGQFAEDKSHNGRMNLSRQATGIFRPLGSLRDKTHSGGSEVWRKTADDSVGAAIEQPVELVHGELPSNRGSSVWKAGRLWISRLDFDQYNWPLA